MFVYQRVVLFIRGGENCESFEGPFSILQGKRKSMVALVTKLDAAAKGQSAFHLAFSKT